MKREPTELSSENLKLSELQKYIREIETHRGFEKQGLVEKCLHLGEEVGELFKAVRKLEGLAIDLESETGTIEEELADVLFFLCAIANRCNVDLGQAVVAKERLNMKRTWHRQIQF